jgi:hypothetical protein
MGHILLKLFPDGRVEQTLRARSWKEREQLLAYGMYLQPGLAALDVAAHLWRDLRASTADPADATSRGGEQCAPSRRAP